MLSCSVPIAFNTPSIVKVCVLSNKNSVPGSSVTVSLLAIYISPVIVYPAEV